MQEENLEIILKDSIQKSIKENIQEVTLIIPPNIFHNMFGGSYGSLQDYLKLLCSRYKLEVDATNDFHHGVKVIFRRDGYYYSKEDIKKINI